MDVLSCGHAAHAAASRSCLHLVVEEPPDHHRWLRGVGMEFDVVCGPCADRGDPEAVLNPVCEGCVARLEDWSGMLGWRGQPEVRHRDVPVGGTWAERDCPARPVDDRCVAPLADGWLILTGEGLVEVPAAGDVRVIGAVDVVAEPAGEWAGHVRGPALHVSPDGRYAAVVTDYGRHGSVVNLADGAVLLRLDRECYHCETTPFPVAFVRGGSVLVAATAWNRLDAFHLPSGRLLTARDTSWPKGTPRPEHHLDYFHGALHPSPSGGRLLDDGWVWHPCGMAHVHDVTAWLDGDRYAVERSRWLTRRDYAWDQPVAWIDDDTVAIQRIGQDDEAMIDGVELYDAATHRLAGMFAGPAGRMWAGGGRLYVVAPEGLEVWDPVAGARVGYVAGFRPLARNPRTGAFAELTEDRLRSWTPA